MKKIFASLMIAVLVTALIASAVYALADRDNTIRKPPPECKECVTPKPTPECKECEPTRPAPLPGDVRGGE